ncbi:hypothetical protein BIU88_09100 [Chlorobaculum limnaeum]|uniref:Uncharacterized protein n=1 Tax=Chlorobaculum limnaeum TaxID=274537 RepID=A0A1D8D278_CHLLM|nr:hypothetical protein [Chlorobaculum limnaeum]AOS84273.1 hypothetical protein BIU88_09100 [Chlorobaculum limnaeum]
MNYLRFNELFWEFSDYIEEVHSLYLDSIVGYELLHDGLETQQEEIRKWLGDHEYAKKEFQDTRSIGYPDLGGGDHQIISMSAEMTQGDLRKRVETDGRNAQILGNMLVVSVYAYWEEYLRIEIGKAKGVLSPDAKNSEETRKVLNKKVVSDFWGDLRYLRNSIVHSHGVANSDMARCKIIKWFKPGDKIVLSYAMVRALFIKIALYRNEIYSLQFPPSFIHIPKGSDDVD